VTGGSYYTARHAFDTPPDPAAPETVRADGNNGHTHIDFGGQWTLARLVAAGRGRELYLRPAQAEVVRAAYPREHEAPGQKGSDADNLFGSMMDLAPDEPDGPRVGGPLYPPTQAVLFAPLGLLPPWAAYHAMQVLLLASAWLAGWAMSRLSGGRVWWPVATVFVIAFPGYTGGLHLGQNSAVSLAILCVGWLLVARGWPVAGGAVWGLLAYKPVWAAAFLLVPLLTRRWRMAAGMLAAGIAFGLLTVPVVGVKSWFHWLRIGRAAADLYKVDENWIFLSRDLLGMPRRWVLNFGEKAETRDRASAAQIGYGLLAAVVGATAGVALARRRTVGGVAGYGPAFVGIGAWASCFHFLYYDSLLAALPVSLLLLEPGRFLRPVVLAATPLPDEAAKTFATRPLRDSIPEPVRADIGPRAVAVLNSAVLTFVALLLLIERSFNYVGVVATVSIGALPTDGAFPNPLKFSTHQHGTPWDTFVLLGLWAYCGARVLMDEPTDGRPWASTA
jgi:hypothetical protein